MIEAAKHVCPDKVKAFQNIALTPNTVASRVQELGDDLHMQLDNISEKFEAFSIAIDESTDVRDTAQLAVFIRGVDKQLQVTEELLQLVAMHNTTTGEDVFVKVEELLDQMKAKWDKLVCLATDGAPSMTGVRKGVGAKFRARLSAMGITTPFKHFHCMIHQDALCGKVLKMDHVMCPVVKTVNFIRKKGLNHRQFASLMEDMGSDYVELPYHTDVRWLSRGNVLNRFYKMREEIIIFLEMKGEDATLFNDQNWTQDLAFFADITGHLNDLNTKLQGRNQLVTNMCDNVKAFSVKLRLWESQLKAENIAHFPLCKELREKSSDTLVFRKYAVNIADLMTDFGQRFQDFKSCEEEFSLFTNPFAINVNNAPENVQMELIELQCESLLKAKFSEVEVLEFYKFLPDDRFPYLRANAARVIAMFGSTYLCEQLFSLMNLNKSPLRSQLTDEHLAAVMKVVSAQKLTPDVARLVSSKRCQISGQKMKM